MSAACVNHVTDKLLDFWCFGGTLAGAVGPYSWAYLEVCRAHQSRSSSGYVECKCGQIRGGCFAVRASNPYHPQ